MRKHSKFTRRQLEGALPPESGSHDDRLYRVALAVEADDVLTLEMGKWETATLDDGLTAPKRMRGGV